MLSFKGKEKYVEFVRTIGMGLENDSYDFCLASLNERGLKYLASIKDEELQRKIIETLNYIDGDMDTFPYQDEMYRKLAFFLKVGIIFGEFSECAKKLSPKAISTLLTESHFPIEDETCKYIPLFSDNDMLLFIRKNYPYGDDIFFAIEQHYDKESFDISNEKKLSSFRQREIKRLKKDKKEFLSDVKSIQDFAEETKQEIERGVKK